MTGIEPSQVEMVSQTGLPEQRRHSVLKKRRAGRGRPGHQASSLRPPTLMIDLLFGALMLFAFQMGNPNASQIQTHDIEVPSAAENNETKPSRVVPLMPVRAGRETWSYRLSGGQVLSAAEVAKFIGDDGKTPVLVVPKSESVQNYLDAEQPLRQLGLRVGLAVALEKGKSK